MVDRVPQNFIMADFSVDTAPHIIMMSPRQKDLLSLATTWFVDGTFRLVKAPFMQLFVIQAFVTNDECSKNIPLAFVLMSRRTMVDYVEVLNRICHSLPSISVQVITLDYERAAWNAIKQVIPDVQIKGCLFHYAQVLQLYLIYNNSYSNIISIQSVMRKARKIGLTTAYHECDRTRNYIRMCMALPLLPPEHICQKFKDISAHIRDDDDLLKQLRDYMTRQWLKSNVHQLDEISVCGKLTRINNNAEGYHSKLNKSGKVSYLYNKYYCVTISLTYYNTIQLNMNLYSLIELLHKEALDANITASLVNLKKISKNHRTVYANANTTLLGYWQNYFNGEMTAEQLLKTGSYLLNSSENEITIQIDD